ncbi:MAG: filamentous hemagglutinin N-terminal domain-containing protein, partial [Pseudomonadota bacterium]
MAVASRKIRSRMLMTTALVAITAIPSAAHAQLVTSADLSSAVDSAGNPNQLAVTTNVAGDTTDMEVQAAVVVAEWTDFNIDMGDTVNVTINGGLGIAEATLFNRVIGGNPSNINGTINAAGINFWLVNQNGILFGNDTAINAQSFFASTIDVANQDVFDFYEATDLFGNGTDTLNFAGASTDAVQALGNASFVTDGSLAFVGQQLDLTGTFDAQTGRAAFIAASDVDVSFTPGSPLTYTVNAGTTIAAQSVDGTVTGGIVDFAMLSAAGVVGALLDIDASVTATTALATDRGISLLAQGTPTVTVEIGGPFSSTGEVELTSTGDLTATANIEGSDLDINAVGAINTADLTSSDGNIDLNAGTTITAGAVDTSGNGGAILTAAGNITTSSITSNEPGATNGFIDVESTGGGTLDLGALSSDGDIALDTSGLITTASITTLNDLTIGGTTTPTMVTFTGNVDADIVDITATGTVSGFGIDATDGDLDITANVIDAGNVSATGGDVILNAAGNITTTSITSNEDVLMMGGAVTVDSTGGNLDLGTINADGAVSATALAGNVTTGDVTTQDGNIFMDAIFVTTQDLDANGGGSVRLFGQADVTTGNVTANEPGVLNGFIEIASTAGGGLDLGVLTTDGDVTLDSISAMMIDGVNALGDLTIGAGIDPSGVTFTGNVEADNVSIVSNTFVDGLDIEASDGDLTITAGSTIDAGHVSAIGGDVTLTAPGNITTTSITANEDFLMMGGAIDVDSTLGGDLDLGDLTADGDIALDTTGALMGGNVTTGGNLLIGNTNQPSSVTFIGDLTASSFALNLTGPFATNNITATAGDVDIDAQSIDAAWVMATGGDVLLTALGDITTTSIMATAVGMVGGNIDVDSTGGGALDLGDLTADDAIALDTSGTLTANTISASGALGIGQTAMPSTVSFTGNATAGSMDIDTTDGFAGLDLEATSGGIAVDVSSIFAPAGIAADTITATGGDVVLQTGSGAITTASIVANSVGMVGGTINVNSTLAGALDVGDLTADGDITLDSINTILANRVIAGGAFDVGVLNGSAVSTTFTDDITAGSVRLFSLIAPMTTQNVTATSGNVEVGPGQTTVVMGDVSATGGDVILLVREEITTTSITAVSAGMVGGS